MIIGFLSDFGWKIKTPTQKMRQGLNVFDANEIQFDSTTFTSFLDRPLEENLTVPSAVAKSVSSPARRTFTPGWNLVPRCFRIIPPARIDWPSATFTPKCFALESRPFLELPIPFLCAMVTCPQF
jgi:hypothetical protein